MSKNIKFLVPELKKSLDAFQTEMAEDVKTQVELDSPRKTGKLAASWVTSKAGGDIIVGNTTDYAGDVELGTRRKTPLKFAEKAVIKQAAIKRNMKNVT